MADSSLRIPIVAGAEASIATDESGDVHTLTLADETGAGTDSSIRLPLAAGAEASIATLLVSGVHALKVTGP